MGAVAPTAPTLSRSLCFGSMEPKVPILTTYSYVPIKQAKSYSKSEQTLNKNSNVLLARIFAGWKMSQFFSCDYASLIGTEE